MSKLLDLHGSKAMIDRLVEAMQTYAQAAYPKGGSECAQVSREALVTAAQTMQDSHDATRDVAHLNKRQRAITKAAVKYYAQQLAEAEACVAQAREQLLLALIAGDVVTDEQYRLAEAQDRIEHG